MSTPITKEEFESALSVLEDRIDAMERDIRECKGYIGRDALAIEKELQAILLKYLAHKYPLYTITEFPMKFIYDPLTDIKVSDLDAAFLLHPLSLKTNTTDFARLRAAGISPPSMAASEPVQEFMFFLGEAKHYVTRGKINFKLYQFQKICEAFDAAAEIFTVAAAAAASAAPSVSPAAAAAAAARSTKYTRTFIKTVERNPFLAKIGHRALFFCGTLWEDNLKKDLESAIQEYRRIADLFDRTTDPEEKYKLYTDAVLLESKWHVNPNKLSLEDIVRLKHLTGPLRYIELVIPSGERYEVSGGVGVGVGIGIGSRRRTRRRMRCRSKNTS
jgi:hypothetical protein